MNKLKIAVIGLGALGKHHARIYSSMDNIELVSVCDINKYRAKKFARLYKTAPHNDYTQLIGRVDAVSIAAPTNLHFQIAKDLLSNNIHVLVEKPITNNLRQAEQLVKLAKDKDLIIQVGHIERFNAAVKTLQSVCQNPRFIECHRMGPFKKRSLDTGVTLDLMIHDIDIILALVKSPVSSIEAMGIPVLTDREDIANARIKFQNGAVANISASRMSKNEMRKIRIFQENAYISLDYIKQTITMFKFKKAKKKIKRSSIHIKRIEPLKEQLDSFVHCVLKDKKPLVSGEEAAAALRIVLDIQSNLSC